MRQKINLLDSGMSNLTAHKLGGAALKFTKYPREKIGDEIDRGLVLCRILREAGFGIVLLSETNDRENHPQGSDLILSNVERSTGRMRDGDFRPELSPFLVSCVCDRSDIGINCICFRCGGMKKEKP
jgi:hypothetical protein